MDFREDGLPGRWNSGKLDFREVLGSPRFKKLKFFFLKLMISTGVGMIKPNTRDLARDLVAEVRRLENRGANG